MLKRTPLTLALLLASSVAQAGQMIVECKGSYTTACSTLSTSYCIELTGDTQGISFSTLQRLRIVALNSTRTIVAGEASVISEQSNGKTVVRILVPAPAAMYSDPSNPDYTIANCSVSW